MSGLDARIPPLAVAAAAGGFMWVIAALTPALRISVPARLLVASGLAVVGALIVVLGVIAFVRARTTVNPTTPGAASALVTTGIYRVTRNPMYLGMALIHGGIALALGSVAAGLMLVPVLAIMNFFVDANSPPEVRLS